MTIFFAWFLADFLSGIGHWAQDRLLTGTYRIGFIKQIQADNDRHHNYPFGIALITYWDNISSTAPMTIPLFAIAYFAGAPAVITLALFFLTFSNLIHRWAHEHPPTVPIVVRLLQRTGVFLSRDHHNLHHYVAGIAIPKDMASRRYCAMSDWLNPTLDRIKFFTRLERLLGIEQKPTGENDHG